MSALTEEQWKTVEEGIKELSKEERETFIEWVLQLKAERDVQKDKQSK